LQYCIATNSKAAQRQQVHRIIVLWSNLEGFSAIAMSALFHASSSIWIGSTVTM